MFRKKRQRAGQGSTKRKETVQSEHADTLEQENGDDPENMDDESEPTSLEVPNLDHSHDQRTYRFSMAEPQVDNEAGTPIMPIPRCERGDLHLLRPN